MNLCGNVLKGKFIGTYIFIFYIAKRRREKKFIQFAIVIYTHIYLFIYFSPHCFRYTELFKWVRFSEFKSHLTCMSSKSGDTSNLLKKNFKNFLTFDYQNQHKLKINFYVQVTVPNYSKYFVKVKMSAFNQF